MNQFEAIKFRQNLQVGVFVVKSNRNPRIRGDYSIKSILNMDTPQIKLDEDHVVARVTEIGEDMIALDYEEFCLETFDYLVRRGEVKKFNFFIDED